MFGFLKNIFKKSGNLNDVVEEAKGHVDSAPLSISDHEDLLDEEVPRYPPFTKGFPLFAADRILATQDELILRIKGIFSLSEEDFEEIVKPLIVAYANFVHLLPASEAHHHRGAGGLFRHGLEVAYWSVQVSDGYIFNSKGTPQENKAEAPCWRLAAFIAGLYHDTGKVVTDLEVVNREGTIKFNPYTETLYDWGVKNGINRYFIRFTSGRHKRHEKFSATVANKIIPNKILSYLSVTGSHILEDMFFAIEGENISKPLTKIMLKSDQESVSRDLRNSKLNQDEFNYGIPVEKYVFDGIRRLIISNQWTVNQEGSKVWVFKSGVYIIWNNLNELFKLIDEDGIPGIPRELNTLAEILIERGYVIPYTVTENGVEYNYRFWKVKPKLYADKGADMEFLMLRLESDQYIFTSQTPSYVQGEILGIDDSLDEIEIKEDNPVDEIVVDNTPVFLDFSDDKALNKKEKAKVKVTDVNPVKDEPKSSEVALSLGLKEGESVDEYGEIHFSLEDNKTKPRVEELEATAFEPKKDDKPTLAEDKAIKSPKAEEKPKEPDAKLQSNPFKRAGQNSFKTPVYEPKEEKAIVAEDKLNSEHIPISKGLIEEETEEVKPVAVVSAKIGNTGIVNPRAVGITAIEQLRDEMIKGKGEFINEPVMKEDNEYSVSIKSLDLISLKYPKLSIHILKGLLRQTSNPKIVLNGERLYLKVVDE